jgi:hypothetical protein
MSERTQPFASLHCHPETPCTAVESIRSSISWEHGKLKISYALKGIVEQLRVPSERAARRTDHLWQHTCFELFIGAKNDAEYYEFNFSPSGEWAAYEFRDYRDGSPMHADGLDPKIKVQCSAESLELSATVRLDRLSGIRSDVDLCVGLCAVIEDINGSLSYWALKHPPGKPDFHHADAFALELGIAG